ncbi:MAG: arsenate reductase (glutaredoxin) [Proteobacteria bacterium]|uniref:arsenate reductase (glutaredoxin) n=1 Tax=Aquabacterium sp. TaxID=1872578 RepID=UPI0035C664FF|nr:arsenate reductase (glutaredoxin) [Pseudomonadota bacterium]
MDHVKIFHNPQCGTSRNTLALIRNAGIEPEVVLYLQTPPTRDELVTLVRDAGLSARQVMRDKGELYEELKLAEPHWTDDQLLDLMVQRPALINRPIVVTPRGTRLCRPSELVLDILPQPQQGPFSKEDGEVVIDAQGRRVK